MILVRLTSKVFPLLLTVPMLFVEKRIQGPAFSQMGMETPLLQSILQMALSNGYQIVLVAPMAMCSAMFHK